MGEHGARPRRHGGHPARRGAARWRGRRDRLRLPVPDRAGDVLPSHTGARPEFGETRRPASCLATPFSRILLVAGAAAGANIASRAAFSLLLPLNPAIVLAYLIGMMTEFALHRRYVVAAGGGAAAPQYKRLGLVNLLALAQIWLVTLAMLQLVLPGLGWEWQAKLVAHAGGVGASMVTRHFGEKFYLLCIRSASGQR